MVEINKPSTRSEEEIEKHGTFASNTVGGSMRPLFKTHRDVVVLKRPDAPIRKYDVVLYKNPSNTKYILHRVIRIKGNTLIIRGDNTFRREYVDPSDVIAVMVSFTRRGKHHTARDAGYKFYSRFWNFIYPVRFVIHYALWPIKKIIRKIAPVKK